MGTFKEGEGRRQGATPFPCHGLLTLWAEDGTAITVRLLHCAANVYDSTHSRSHPFTATSTEAATRKESAVDRTIPLPFPHIEGDEATSKQHPGRVQEDDTWPQDDGDFFDGEDDDPDTHGYQSTVFSSQQPENLAPPTSQDSSQCLPTALPRRLSRKSPSTAQPHSTPPPEASRQTATLETQSQMSGSSDESSETALPASRGKETPTTTRRQRKQSTSQQGSSSREPKAKQSPPLRQSARRQLAHAGTTTVHTPWPRFANRGFGGDSGFSETRRSAPAPTRWPRSTRWGNNPVDIPARLVYSRAIPGNSGHTRKRDNGETNLHGGRHRAALRRASAYSIQMVRQGHALHRAAHWPAQIRRAGGTAVAATRGGADRMSHPNCTCPAPRTSCTAPGWKATCPACGWSHTAPKYTASRDAALREYCEGIGRAPRRTQA